MIRSLLVKNYAIIDFLEMEFSERMNIITGETGAGKSIILGALSLILGERAGSTALMNKDSKCVVEARFDLRPYNLKPDFEALDLDYDDDSIIRREITPALKSRAFINDSPVTLQHLKKITSKLVNLHVQHQTLGLSKPEFQMQIIDGWAGIIENVSAFMQDFSEYSSKRKKLEALLKSNAERENELDYLNFQIDELVAAGLVDDAEKAELQKRLLMAENAEKVARALAESQEVLDGEKGVVSLLQGLKSELDALSHLGDEFLRLSERMESSIIELEDLNSELQNTDTVEELNLAEKNELQERLDLLNRLEQKHRVESISDLQGHLETLISKRDGLNRDDDEVKNLEKQLQVDFQDLTKRARWISEARRKGITSFEGEISELLGRMNMPKAGLKVKLEELSEMRSNGADAIEFVFSANEGIAPAGLKKIASGGELSRLMLAIQSIMARASALPTMILDEIDSGISGETAHKVGRLLEKLSGKHQMIAITHLPQIAAIGDQHFSVFKRMEDGKTVSDVRLLSRKERVEAIAQMMSGEGVNEHTLAGAEALLEGR